GVPGAEPMAVEDALQVALVDLGVAVEGAGEPASRLLRGDEGGDARRRPSFLPRRSCDHLPSSVGPQLSNDRTCFPVSTVPSLTLPVARATGPFPLPQAGEGGERSGRVRERSA